MMGRASILAGLACALAGCFHGYVDGSFAAGSGPGPSWSLSPDHCTSGASAGYVGADMYRDQPGDDTEIVVIQDGGGFRVLARIPNSGEMVVLTPADCERFEATVGYNGVTVNDIPGVSGTVHLDCRRPEIGHVTGKARFTCY